MIVKRVNLCALDTGSLILGYVGENDHTQIRINCASVFADYPAAVVSMTVKAPSGVVYPREVETDGQVVIWTITDSDTASAGNGQIQLTFTEDGTIVKTVIAVTTVRASLVGDNPPPDPITDWIDEAGEALAKLEGITASATQLPAGEDPTAEVEVVDGHYNIALGLPGGDAGSIIDDTAGAGDTDKAWSADKLTDEFSTVSDDITGLKNAVDGAKYFHPGFENCADTSRTVNSITYTRKANAVVIDGNRTGSTYFGVVINNPDLINKNTSADTTCKNPYCKLVAGRKYRVRYRTISGSISAATSGPSAVDLRALCVTDTAIIENVLMAELTMPYTANGQIYETIITPSVDCNLGLRPYVRNNNFSALVLAVDVEDITGIIGVDNAETVSGSTPTITGESGKRYICGTVDSISITPPSMGIIDVIFTSGTTAALLTVPSSVRFPVWFNASALDASTTYEVNISDGVWGAVMVWK